MEKEQENPLTEAELDAAEAEAHECLHMISMMFVVAQMKGISADSMSFALTHSLVKMLRENGIPKERLVAQVSKMFDAMDAEEEPKTQEKTNAEADPAHP